MKELPRQASLGVIARKDAEVGSPASRFKRDYRRE